MKKLFLTVIISLVGWLTFAEPMSPRTLLIPCQSESLAVNVASGDKDPTDSRWVMALGGEWKDGKLRAQFSRPWRWWFRRTVIRFSGASAEFELIVNGKSQGVGVGDGMPVEFDVSDALNIFFSNDVEVVRKGKPGVICQALIVSERYGAPHNMVVSTEIAADGKSGRFIVRDEAGQVLKEREVPELKMWLPSKPILYLTPIKYEWGWWIFGGTDYYAITIGFVDKRIGGMKGVNRVEPDGELGCKLRFEDMVKDLRILKAYGVEYARGSRYPRFDVWFTLCDILGMAMVFDANEWKTSRAAGFFGNHPSVFLTDDKLVLSALDAMPEWRLDEKRIPMGDVKQTVKAKYYVEENE